MSSRLNAQFWARFLTALSILLALSVAGGTCTGNVGAIFDPPGGGDDDGGGGDDDDGTTSAAPVQGALFKAGRPVLSAMAPFSGATGIDVKAVVVLWFSESLNFNTLTTASLGLRERESGTEVAHSKLSFAADRCIALVPGSDLETGTLYEVFATTDATDLDGSRLVVPASEVLGSFRTSGMATGVAPRVLGSFPPGGSASNPNDYPALIVFSKPIDFTTISGATAISNTTTAMPGSYGSPESNAGDRIIEFPHLDADADLGADMTVTVDMTVTDTEFVPLPLSAVYAASWATLAFGQPLMIDLLGQLAVNIGNIAAFDSDVVVPASVLGTDTVRFRLYQSNGQEFVENSTPTAVALPTFSFTSDLETAGGDNRLSDGPLILCAFVQRDSLRSTAFVLQGFFQDTVRPSLIRFGPPNSNLATRFVTAVPELRPYGRATEPITIVDAEFPVLSGFESRTVAFGDATGFFMGPSFPVAGISEGPVDFKLAMTDAAGNPMNPANEALDGDAIFRGFVGGAALVASDLRVVAFDDRTLSPIVGATVYIEDAGGAAATSGLTQSDGSAVFAGRTGAQTVTIVHPDYFGVTLLETDSDLLSLPLRSASPLSLSIDPIVTGATMGDLQLAGHTLRDGFGADRPDGLLNFALPLDFAFVQVRPDQPAWFSAFHDVTPFGGDPVTGRYFERLGVDVCRIVPPSDPSTAGVQPIIPLFPSTNALADTTDFIYSMTLAPGAGFDVPPSSSSVSAVVRIPGTAGVAAVGAGALDDPPTDAEVEVEAGLHALAAIEEGSDPLDIVLQVYAVDDFGDETLLRETVALDPSPPVEALVLPDIPVSLPQTSPQAFPPSLDFVDSLGGGDGYYLLVLEDSAPFPAQWDVWVPASVGAGGTVDLPTLDGDSANSPLELGSWTLFCEAFGMPAGFSETAFFFTALRRDNESWARSIPGPPFTVDP